MRKKYTKIYFERYAALSIAHYLKLPINHFVQADRPDIQLAKEEYGIEVTQAIGLNEYNHYKSYLYENLAMLKKEARMNVDEVHHAIMRKQEKSKQYKVFSHNGLYIFTHHTNWNEAILCKFFEERIESLFFYDFYMINSINRIYIYHVQGKRLETYYFSTHKLKQMHWDSLQYEHEASS